MLSCVFIKTFCHAFQCASYGFDKNHQKIQRKPMADQHFPPPLTGSDFVKK